MKEFIERLKVFVKDVRGELEKVTWPTREETIASTFVTVVVVVVMSVFIGMNDMVYRFVLGVFFGK